jgi:hypothetical protein
MVGFDYTAIDSNSEEPLTPDAEFWAAQGELLGDILRWLTRPRSLSAMGARCCLLALYLNPDIVNKCRLADISCMKGAPGPAALSKAMIEFQRRYNLKPSYYQRPLWMRERYRRSAIVAHQHKEPTT